MTGLTFAVLWIGINDVSGVDHTLVEDAMEAIQDILGRCYKLGFRNLLLIDVPPRKLLKPDVKGGTYELHSASADIPAPSIYKVIANNVEEWNTALEEELITWTERRGTFGKIFSAHHLFSDIMAHPIQYDFEPSDAYTSPGGIWADPIHPSTKIHELLFAEIKAEMGIRLTS